MTHSEKQASRKRVLMSNLVDFGRGEGDAGHQAALFAHFSSAGHGVRMLAPTRSGAAAALACFAPRVMLTFSTTHYGLPASCDALWQLPYILYARLVWRMQTLYVRVTLFCVLQVLLARMLGMRVVVEHNGWMASERRARGGGATMMAIERWAQIGAARLAHRSRCVTDGIARLLVEGGCARERLFVLGNGVDLEKFSPRISSSAPRAQLRLGFIGVLTVWQGVATALGALSELKDLPGLELTIAGDGPLNDELRVRTEALGLGQQVRFLGKVAAADAPAVINEFDIALAPYTLARNAEIGLSAIKIRDYAGCGKPVIAARLPGIAELEAAGWLVTHTPDDPTDLARAIRELVMRGADPLAVMGRRARSYAETHFDWAVIAHGAMAEC